MKVWCAELVALVAAMALIPAASAAGSLEEMTEAEAAKLVEQEQYVIVLFAGGDGSGAAGSKKVRAEEEWEAALSQVREDMVDSINAWVVKVVAVDSKAPKEGPPTMKSQYVPDIPGPAVVFFRNRRPVYYDGAADEDEILETLMQWREPCTQDLTDTTFEHLTQAASGATTGDWLIFFHRDDCGESCDRLYATLETVACRFKGRSNVAKINRFSTGSVTGRRLGISEVPSLVFLRLGRLYRYTMEKYDVESLSSFISGWYKNVQAESIPLPKTPFDDFVQLCVDYLRENPLLSAAMVGLPVLMLVAFLYLLSGEDEKPAKSKKKKAAPKKDK